MPKAWEKTLHQTKDKSPREEEEPSHTPTRVWAMS